MSSVTIVATLVVSGMLTALAGPIPVGAEAARVEAARAATIGSLDGRRPNRHDRPIQQAGSRRSSEGIERNVCKEELRI